MQRSLAVLAMAALSVTAVACSGDDDAAESPSSTSGAVAATSAPATPRPVATATTDEASAYPVTIEHKFGSTTIPAPPQRVLSLGYTEQDAIVALGVEPVGVRYAFGPEDDVFFPWADEAAGASDPEILPRTDINFEQIAALEPDLIMAITAGLTQEQYDTLSEVAPVVVQPADYVDFGTPWQVQTLITGQALGQESAAEAMIAEVESAIAATRAEHPEFEGLAVAVSGPTYEGEYPFHSSADPRGRFFTDLGLVVPQELDDVAGDQFYGALSKENAALLDTDVLAWQAGSPEEKAAIEADPILAALPVVQDGRAIFIEGSDYDAFQFVSVLSLPYLLASFVPKLASTVAG